MPTLRLADGSKVFAAGRGFGVQAGERLVFRFTADSPKQLESMNFTTTGPRSRILGLYNMGPYIRDIEVDTRPGEPYELFIERETDSPLPETVFGPLKIVPRNLFIEVSAEGQMDPNACWAASIAWWSSAMRDRPTLTQQALLMRFAGMWNGDGTINIDKFEKGVKESSDLRMTTKRINPSSLKGLLGCWPIVIGFRAPGGFGHMNVLYGWGPGGKVKAMDPWFPDPGPDGLGTDAGFMYLTDPNFKFSGQLMTQEAKYWEKPAPGQAQLIVAYPQEYLDKLEV
jgi:hypothetical protein